jgi:mono/diheme cytochrome c family protein
MRAVVVLLAFGLRATSAPDAAALEAGKKAEQQACVPCHSLRLIHSQRLSAAAWEKEINKMVGWGAVVPDRAVLLEYLAQEYGDAKPAPSPQLSTPAQPGSSQKQPGH